MKIFTKRLHLRTPKRSDASLFAAFERKNQGHFSQFAPGNMQEEHWEKAVETYLEEEKRGISYRFLFFEKQKPDGPVIGKANFTQIFRGPFHACYLGYKIDRDFEGKGLMHEGLKGAIDYLFDEKNLHRIMANYMPDNLRSEKLLHRLGFQKEGFAKDYLLINNQWEDHVLTSLTNPNWRKP